MLDNHKYDYKYDIHMYTTCFINLKHQNINITSQATGQKNISQTCNFTFNNYIYSPF